MTVEAGSATQVRSGNSQDGLASYRPSMAENGNMNAPPELKEDDSELSRDALADSEAQGFSRAASIRKSLRQCLPNALLASRSPALSATLV